MKEIEIYFNGNIIKKINCDEVIPSPDNKLWMVYLEEKLIASIPMEYLILKIN